MPKIKEIGNKKLLEYLNAYEYKADTFPDNEDFAFRVVAIGKVLRDRELLGISIGEKSTPGFFAKILTKLKIKK